MPKPKRQLKTIVLARLKNYELDAVTLRDKLNEALAMITTDGHLSVEIDTEDDGYGCYSSCLEIHLTRRETDEEAKERAEEEKRTRDEIKASEIRTLDRLVKKYKKELRNFVE